MQLEDLLRRVFVSPYTWLVPALAPVEVAWVSVVPQLVEPGDVFLAETHSDPGMWQEALAQGAQALVLIGKERPPEPPTGVPVVWVQTPHTLSTVYRHLLQTLMQPVGELHPRTLFWMLLMGEGGNLGNLRLAVESVGLSVTRSYRVLRIVTPKATAVLQQLKQMLPGPPESVVAAIRPGELAALLADRADPERGEEWRQRLNRLWEPRDTFYWALTQPYAWMEWPHAFQKAGTILEIARRLTVLSGLLEDEALPYLWMLERTHPEEARALVHRVLGPILSHPEREALMRSLEALFLYPNLAQAARALFIHRNTLRQRLQRVAHLTGYRFDHPHHRWALHLAWFWYRWLYA